ncbi:MAG: hypothetical protein LCH47_00045, partial [Proteobacteria bacterium]|nr:hypothetical protein [Pseudomonadota bacterium]
MALELRPHPSGYFDDPPHGKVERQNAQGTQQPERCLGDQPVNRGSIIYTPCQISPAFVFAAGLARILKSVKRFSDKMRAKRPRILKSVKRFSDKMRAKKTAHPEKCE